MAQRLVSRPEASIGSLSDVDTTQRNALGLRIMGVDDFGNTAEYIYLKGVASTIAGSVVNYDEAAVTTLIGAGTKGPVAVAMAATVASTFGWYGIAGTFTTDVVANCADNANLGRETTDGKVGDGAAAGDSIFGAVSRNSTTAAALIYCQFIYPSTNGKSA